MSVTTTPPALTPRRARGRRVTWLPGCALAVGVSLFAVAASRALPLLSPVLLCILAGAVVASLVRLPAVVQPGLAVASRRLLRIGIVLLGLQVSLASIAALGPTMVLTVVAVVGLGIPTTLVVGRWLGVPLPQRILIACGFSICGAAAIAAVEDVADADEDDVAASVALVVLFGTLMIPAVPLLGALVGSHPQTVALLTGASVHEVAQVVAAASIAVPTLVGTAVVVKLARVALLAPVVVGVSWWSRRSAAGSPSGESAARPPLVPLFVLGFLGACLLRSTGLVPDAVLRAGSVVQGVLLGAAMFALGCSVHAGVLRRVGLRPAALGLASTLTVVAVAVVGIQMTP